MSTKHPYPHFLRALEQLAATDAQRADALGVSRGMVLRYRLGRALPSVDIVKKHPTLDDALTRDFRPESNLVTSAYN